MEFPMMSNTWLFSTNIPGTGVAIKVFMSNWIEAANDEVMYSLQKHWLESLAKTLYNYSLNGEIMKYIKGLEKALKKPIREQDEHPLSGSAARKVAMLQREIEAAYRKKNDESIW